MPRSRNGSLNTRIFLLAAAEGLLLWALWWGASRQIGLMNQALNDISELKDPSPFRAALMGHLGKIHLGLEGNLRSPDPALADQVTQSRQDFLASLPEFEKQNPKLFPKTAVEEIHRAFRVFEESIEHTLKTHSRRMDVRSRLAQNFGRIITLVERNIRPLIRKDQADGEERSQAILNVLNQGRAWQQNLEAAWQQPSPSARDVTEENDNRGATYLDRYGRLELLARERKILKELRGLWEANSDLARESFAMEKVVQEAKTFMDAQRQQVVQALNKYLPALPPAEFEARKNGILRKIRLHGAQAMAFGFLAFITLAAVALSIYRLKKGIPLWTRAPRPVAENEQLVKDPTLRMDLNGTISQWSPAAEKLYGYRDKEMKGKSIAALFESESEISRLYQDLLEKPQTTFETIHKAKGGNAFPVRIEFRPVPDTAGHPKAIDLICTRR